MNVTKEMVDRFLTWPVPADVYPDGTPGQPGRTGTNLLNSIQAKLMLEHVLVSEDGAAMLRSALIGLIGAESEQELRQMEVAMRVLPAPEADKAVSINAIHALLATMPA